MNGIGQVLRDARRGSGIQLEQAAWATRLRENYLAALERNEIDSLGLDPAYVRGTVRTYADYLGLDSETLVALHRAGGNGADHGPGGRRRRSVPRMLAGVLGIVVIAVTAFLLGDASARGRLPWSLDVAELAGIVEAQAPADVRDDAEVQGSVDAHDDVAPQESADAHDDPAAHADAREDAADRGGDARASGDRDAVLAAPSAPPLKLRMEFLDEVWVRAETDGEEVFEGIYEPGQIERIQADEEIVLRLGVGGAIEFTLNGAWYGPLAQGRSGPVDLLCDAADGCRVVE